MQKKKSEQPAVKIAVVVSVAVFLVVQMLAALANEYLLMFGWIVIPLTITGLGLAVVTAKENRQGSSADDGRTSSLT